MPLGRFGKLAAMGSFTFVIPLLVLNGILWRQTYIHCAAGSWPDFRYFEKATYIFIFQFFATVLVMVVNYCYGATNQSAKLLI